MMPQSPETGRPIMLVLRLGGMLSFALILAGTALALAGVEELAMETLRSGLLVLLATPVVRVMMAMVVFAHRRDYRYVLVSAGVLTIVLLSWAVGAAH